MGQYEEHKMQMGMITTTSKTHDDDNANKLMTEMEEILKKMEGK